MTTSVHEEGIPKEQLTGIQESCLIGFENNLGDIVAIVNALLLSRSMNLRVREVTLEQPISQSVTDPRIKTEPTGAWVCECRLDGSYRCRCVGGNGKC